MSGVPRIVRAPRLIVEDAPVGDRCGGCGEAAAILVRLENYAHTAPIVTGIPLCGECVADLYEALAPHAVPR